MVVAVYTRSGSTSSHCLPVPNGSSSRFAASAELVGTQFLGDAATRTQALTMRMPTSSLGFQVNFTPDI